MESLALIIFARLLSSWKYPTTSLAKPTISPTFLLCIVGQLHCLVSKWKAFDKTKQKYIHISIWYLNLTHPLTLLHVFLSKTIHRDKGEIRKGTDGKIWRDWAVGEMGNGERGRGKEVEREKGMSSGIQTVNLPVYMYHDICREIYIKTKYYLQLNQANFLCITRTAHNF